LSTRYGCFPGLTTRFWWSVDAIQIQGSASNPVEGNAYGNANLRGSFVHHAVFFLTMRFFIATLLVAFLMIAGSAQAQEAGQTGINARLTSTAPSIGLTVHLTDAFMLRPSVTYQQTEDEQTVAFDLPIPGIPGFSSDVEVESTLIGLSLGGFYFFDTRSHDVLPYLGVDVGYLNRESDQPTATIDPLPGGGFAPRVDTIEVDEDILRVDGVVGFQYRPVDRFALFGEVGLRAEFTEGNAGPGGNTETSGTQIGLLTRAAGIVFYFN
jgi:hypothetical protein